MIKLDELFSRMDKGWDKIGSYLDWLEGVKTDLDKWVEIYGRQLSRQSILPQPCKGCDKKKVKNHALSTIEVKLDLVNSRLSIIERTIKTERKKDGKYL